MPIVSSDVDASTGGGVTLSVLPSPTMRLLAAGRPSNYDGSNAAYARLRKSIVAAGLLDRRYGYYLLRFATSLVLVLAALALVFLVPPAWGWTLFASVVLGFTVNQLGIIGHDAGHMAVFQQERWNFLLGQFCLTFVLGLSFSFWRDRHNTHHVMTNDEGDDPDLEFGGLFTLSEDDAAAQRGLRAWFTRYQAFFFIPVITFSLDWAFRVDGWRHVLTNLTGRRRAGEAGLLLLSHAVWLTPLFYFGWRWLLIYWIAQWFSNLYLGLAFAPNHKGMPVWAQGEKLTFLERQVLSTCNVLPGRVTDYVFCGLNYQIEHHLFPTMPRVNFSRAREIVRQFCPDHGLPYEDLTVFGAYRQAFGELHRCGQFAARA